MGEVRVLARTAVGGMGGRKRGWAWRLYLLAGGLAIGGHFVLQSTTAQNIFTVLIDLSGVAAVVAGILMYRPSHPLPWYLLAFGSSLIVAGDVFGAIYSLGIEYPYPSLADVLYIGSIPLIVAGLLLIGRGGIGRNWANLIDPLIITTGIGMLLWTFLLDPGGRVPTLSLLERLLSITYLAAFVLMLTVVVRPLFVPEKRSPALYLLCSSFGVMIVAFLPWDTTNGGTYSIYEASNLANVGYLLSSALFGAAALHPSMARLSKPVSEAQAKLTWWRLALLTSCTLMAPLVLAIQVALDQPIAVILIVGGSVVLFLLVALRMAGMIEESKRAQQETKEANRRLKELALLKADFTAMVAHELGGPLAAIRRLSEMLGADEGADREAKAYALDTIVAELDTLQTLVADVQASAVMERDDFRVELGPLPLGELLADAKAFCSTLPNEHPVDFILGPDLGTHEKVVADRERIGQVLRNLLSNAVKYSPEGIPIELGAKRNNKEHCVRIEVTDHGPGIHPDDQVRIFEKFGRGRDREGKKIPGVGLGLYLSRGIVQAHGGDIMVDSAPGEGAVFGFELKMGVGR